LGFSEYKPCLGNEIIFATPDGIPRLAGGIGAKLILNSYNDR
jgi:hypothetical protein